MLVQSLQRRVSTAYDLLTNTTNLKHVQCVDEKTIGYVGSHQRLRTIIYCLHQISSDVNKTLLSRPRPRPFYHDQDQDQDLRNFQDQDQGKTFYFKTKTKTKTFLVFLYQNLWSLIQCQHKQQHQDQQKVVVTSHHRHIQSCAGGTWGTIFSLNIPSLGKENTWEQFSPLPFRIFQTPSPFTAL